MSSVRKLEVEMELKSPVDAIWNTVKNINVIYPKLFPKVYKSVQILEGDGKSAGTVRFVTFIEDTHNVGKTEKSKMEYVDEDKKTVSYCVIEGRALKLYKSFQEITMVKPAAVGKEGSVVVWTVMYEKLGEQSPDLDGLKDYIFQLFHKLDAYTLASVDNNNNEEN